MFALLRRVLPTVLGLLFVALFIWYAGWQFRFGEYQPLESERARLIAIAVVVALWAASRVLKRLRANRASDRLAAAVVQQARTEEPRPSADVVLLRERFEEAVAALKQKRRSGHSLYELPWYVIIGAPGSGKTTALVNSGLHFPLEQRSGRGALRGVGGTRNCDWWFTDEAVFLDTAGRYTTQDSDASADSTGWKEFLGLLRKYRKRRPVNGVILTISAQDLMSGHGAPEEHVDAARRRLIEVNRELKIQLPVYLMVTKCDLVAGFTEYFDDFNQEGRAQIWGVTFPYELTQKGDTPKAFPAEFDALMTRLNERVFARVEDDRDVRRRTRVFGFPQQMASLRESLTQFVADVFGATRFDQRVLLRGVYFTSGTQEGTPIDRLLGAIGRRFAVAADAVMPAPGRGKAYFIERLLKDVVFAESGLAGVNRRFEFQMAAAQLGAYVALAAVAILGVIVWSVSYARNARFIEAVGAEATRLQAAPLTPDDVAVDAALPRLDAVQKVVAAASPADVRWSMRWGLYQGNAFGNAARDAYVRELNGAFLPRVEARLRQRLLDYAAEPETLYEYLKAYLMLGDARRVNKQYLAAVVDAEWMRSYAAVPDTASALSRHFRALLENADTLPEVELDDVRIAQARATIDLASIPRIIFNNITFLYSGDGRVLRLNELAGAASDQVLRRKSGRSLSDPVPALYTKAVFDEVTGKSAGELVSDFIADDWVWGDTRRVRPTESQLQADVIDVYEKEYIAYWDAILKDVDVAFQPQQTANALAILAGPTSPLRGLLRAVDRETRLAKPPEPGQPSGLIDSAVERAGKLVNRSLEKIGVSTAVPGAQVTAYFAPVHALVAGEAGTAPIDLVLGKVLQLQQQISPVGQAVGGTNPIDAITRSGSGELVKAIRQDAAALPPTVGNMVTSIADRAAGAVRADVRGDLEARYLQDVVTACRAIVNDRYPFVKTSAVDVRPEDFGSLFGYGGIFDTFFKERMDSLVDRSRQQWSWRRDASGVQVGGSAAMLRQFETAQRIREMYFSSGEKVPQLRFSVAPLTMDQATARLVLEIEGQIMPYQFGPERSFQTVWPGAKPGNAAVIFEEKGGRAPNIARTGPWAWQRLVDAAEIKEETDTRYLLTWRRETHYATVHIEATSIRNPFNKPDIQQFRCG